MAQKQPQGRVQYKRLRKVKMIIGWEVIQNLKAAILKINQSAFIKKLFEQKNLADYNSINIFMITESIINMNNTNNYKKTYIKAYQRLIGKLI